MLLTLMRSPGRRLPPSAGGHPLALGWLGGSQHVGSFGQKELQRLGGVACPCGLIHVS